ncbi:YbaK/EbsC family protein [Delftia acidovorans]|uniref:YbaK/EbsC family protein n=1 Tax=Delftia acidovorans TaxID=80866 RepID=A0AAJ2R1J4_DELAC|nr:YbaK/EbsC family protein [Delftia acidovorans]MDX4953628.1 YbaK/EbsC family protein [Delftia acidovorans]
MTKSLEGNDMGKAEPMGELADDVVSASPRERLFSRLASLGIKAEVVPYPAHSTVEEGKALRGSMAGTFTKNLLLKDKKGKLFLLSIYENRAIDLKSLSSLIGGKGHLSFVLAERMQDLLGVVPDALTPMGLINDGDSLITAVIDASLMTSAQLNFHPLVNTESMGISPAGLVSFVRSCGREPLIVDFDAGEGETSV